ncbi:MAG TPA: hypothetical protein VMT62_10930 [Syntrophorhabdaceae bacterium]|nr:hypothetical protein [Syntrophorhabdaceae bacterium]
MMKLFLKDQPRIFEVGDISIRDYGKISFENNEMLTLLTAAGRECDITAKDWGFYLTPSINARLREQGFKVALVKDPQGKLFINAVEEEKMALFEEYLTGGQNGSVICWLDEWSETERINANQESNDSFKRKM